MNAMMFLSTNTAAFLVFAGFAVAAFSGLWSLVVAAQRSILWLLAVIFIPFASIIILFVEPRSRKPFFIGLCATIAVIVGGIRIDQASGESDSKPVQVIEEVIRMVGVIVGAQHHVEQPTGAKAHVTQETRGATVRRPVIL